MLSLAHYQDLTARGDGNAALEAAKIMRLERYSEYLVQAQLRRAAALGNVEAMRQLGFLGLGGKLLHPDSSAANPILYQTREPAFAWFIEGDKQGDSLSTLLVGLCIEHGLGTEADVSRGREIITKVADKIPMDVALGVVLFVNTLHPMREMDDLHSPSTPQRSPFGD